MSFSRRRLFHLSGAASFAAGSAHGAAPAGDQAVLAKTDELRFRRPHPASADVVWAPGTSFIWHAAEAVYWEPPRNRFCYFRKTFALPDAVAETEVRIVADTRYVLYVNGHYVGRGPSRFDPRWAYYDVHDVGRDTADGKNVAAVLVFFHGYGTGAQASIMQMLLFHARFRLAGGADVFVVSDPSWKAQIAEAYDSTVPRLSGRQGPIEVLDLQKVPENWTGPDFDDSSWSATATVLPRLSNAPWFNLVPRDIPQLEESGVPWHATPALGASDGRPPEVASLGAIRKNIQWTEQNLPVGGVPLGGFGDRKAAVVNLDFGRVEAGLLELEIMAPSGGTVDVLYAEELWNGLVPQFSNCRIPCDRFLLKKGANRAGVQFGFKAFRYAQLWIWSERPVTLQHAYIRKLGYPVPDVKPLSTSDEMLNRISGIATHTLRLCMQDGFLDSASREQQQWIGDGRKQAITAFYLFGEHKLWRRMLEQIGQSQDWTGVTQARYPGRHENISPIPGFCLAWVGAMWDYYWATGRDDLMAQWWPNIVLALRWFTAFENADGLLGDLPHWAFIDWGDHPNGPGMDVENAGIVTPLNLMYLEALSLAARMAEHLGDSSAQAHYSILSRRIPKALFRTCWDARRNAFVDRVVAGNLSRVVSEPTNTLALLHLPLSAADARGIISAVFERTSGEGIVRGSPNFVLETGRALHKYGRTLLALELFRQRYGRIIEAGATSTWERWDLFVRSDQQPPYCTSASHGWGASINTFLAESVLGVRILEPGCRSRRDQAQCRPVGECRRRGRDCAGKSESRLAEARQGGRTGGRDSARGAGNTLPPQRRAAGRSRDGFPVPSACSAQHKETRNEYQSKTTADRRGCYARRGQTCQFRGGAAL